MDSQRQSRPLWSGLTVGAVALIVGCAGEAPDRFALEAGNPAPAVATAVSALGRLEPASRVLQVAAASGNEGTRIERLLVEEGDKVNAGQVIAVLDNNERLAAAVAVAESEAAAASARLAVVRAGAKQGDLEAKRVEMRQIQANANYYETLNGRGQRLAETNSLSAEEREQRQWDYDRAVLDYERSAAELDSLSEVRGVDVLQAEREVEVAEATVRQRKADLATTEVVAPIDGTILKVYSRVGERVGDQGLVALADTRHMQAVAEVFEADLQRVAPGDQAEIRVASSGKLLRGVVAEVGRIVARKDVLSNDPISDIDARVVEVRIDLDLDAGSVVRRLSNARVEAIIQVGPREPVRTARATP